MWVVKNLKFLNDKRYIGFVNHKLSSHAKLNEAMTFEDEIAAKRFIKGLSFGLIKPSELSDHYGAVYESERAEMYLVSEENEQEYTSYQSNAQNVLV